MARVVELTPLQVRGLVYESRGKRLIDGIDLWIDGPGITVLMGPNGAGKSLLLRALHGLIRPTGGSVLWGGQPPNEPVRRRQSMVFQRPVLLRRTVVANIEFALGLRGMGGKDRCLEVLQQAGLAARARQPARSLSGGEQQRLVLARALALEPEVLLLDEPTASVDPASTAVIESIVNSARTAGTKVLFVTHDVGQARRLGDDVVFLHRGRVTEHSPSSVFFTSPASIEAADYLAGRILL